MKGIKFLRFVFAPIQLKLPAAGEFLLLGGVSAGAVPARAAFA